MVEAPVEPVSYQGRLSDGGSPANGSYDFQFLLKDAVTSGTTLGEVLTMTLPVQNGVFSAALPWKSSLFTGAARWVEVRVRPTPPAGASGTEADAPYAVLERQRLSTTPYAFRSQTSGTVESVPVSSLPASVPLKGADGKIDSGLLAADIARTASVEALSLEAATLKASVASLSKDINTQLSTQLSTLTQDSAVTKQSVLTLEGANTTRIAEIAALADRVKALEDKSAAALASLSKDVNTQLTAIRQSVVTISAPSKSGWMAASVLANDPELVAAGFTLVSSSPAPTWQQIVPPSNSGRIPSPRSGVSSVWTGSEWILWGGQIAGQTTVKSGGKYRLDSNSWTDITEVDAPEARTGHTAVWTGTEMIIWGGFNRASVRSGARYTPNPQSWVPVSLTGAPPGTTGHGAVWTGKYMVVFGGKSVARVYASASMYNPVSDTWTLLPSQGGPSARQGASVVWTGSSLVVWGGEVGDGDWASGAVLQFGADGNPLAWSPMEKLDGFAGRAGHVTEWDGKRMIVWGGRSSNGAVLSDGAVWDSTTKKWTLIPSVGAPEGRFDASSAWNGQEFLIYGGSTSQNVLSSGAAWNPVSGTWRSLSVSTARSKAVSVIVGKQWLIFGGSAGTANTLSDPQWIDTTPSWNIYRRGSLPAESLPTSSP